MVHPVTEDTCWICGTDKGITKHHVIPVSYFKPKQNITIPLCKSCHQELHYCYHLAYIGSTDYLESKMKPYRFYNNTVQKMLSKNLPVEVKP